MSNNISSVKETLTEVKRNVDEQKDRENRAANLIIYNVTESNATTPEERWSEDQQFCLETFNKILNIHIVTGDIKKVV